MSGIFQFLQSLVKSKTIWDYEVKESSLEELFVVIEDKLAEKEKS